MMESPLNQMDSYGSLPDGEMKDEACKMCEGKTVEQLRRLGEFFSSKASNMSREMEKSLTMEDFEKIKKQDIDDDQEAGEKGESY